ncbi:unnamed protein product [Brassicogethes aeneus]|uniref:PXA domain-containing protein n=1 Tax=Brassicogethes aeneus TaxID=1431903 RepID=A0A9P0B290_BRAAE|nr:unnamed protein product [Brassicogethes aeneus]
MSINSTLLSWKFFVAVFSSVILLGFLNYSLEIVPVSGLTFVITFVAVWFVSLFITLITFHKMLQKNKPIDLEFFKVANAKTPEKTFMLKPDSEAVKKLAEDIDKYFITKWYRYISVNNDFTAESKCVLEDVLNRLSEVLMQVNSKKLLHGILNIYLKHLKEFRRTLKRKEKYGGEIGELYRYSHVCINSEQSQKYYLHQLTINLLNHFINWELWNSLPCHALVSIIARKLTTYILNLLSSPLFLNYHILNLIGSKAVKSSMKLENYSKICFEENFDVTYSGNNQDEVDEIVKGKVSKDTKKQVHNTEQEEKEKMVIKKESPKKKKVTPIEIKPVIVNEPPAEVIVQDPVKIHEPKGSSSKVWNDSQDLISVSFGMDPLDSFLGDDKPPKTHWDGKVGKVDDPVESPTSATNMLLNEVRHITSMEGIRSSIKPISDATVTTLHNIKDLQESTVNNAMTKLGDFQVNFKKIKLNKCCNHCTSLHVPNTHDSHQYLR